MRRNLLCLLSCSAAASCSVNLARGDLPNFAISAPLGLTDAKHTNANGQRTSQIYYAKGTYSSGSSDQFIQNSYGGGNVIGKSAWWSDGTRTVRLGFTGFDYTSRFGFETGLQHSGVVGMNSAGLTIGRSARNPSGSWWADLGTPWVWDGTTLTELGMDGPGYRDGSNRRQASVVARGINEAGQILGVSGQYSGSQHIGNTPWFYQNGVYHPFASPGAEFKSDSEVYDLNENGQVIGQTRRASDNAEFGWISDGSDYTFVGLVRPDNYDVTPFDYSTPQMMNEAGQVAGMAMDFLSSTTSIYAVWLFDGTETKRIGLTGDEFTGELTRFQRSELRTLTNSGLALGTSSLISEPYGYDFGTATWVSDGDSTRRTGLWGPEHTRQDGWQHTYSPFITESGWSSGISNRFSGSTDMGATAWVDDGVTSWSVGHYGTEFTRADGFQSSSIVDMNESGDVSGYSILYSGMNESGRVGWFYDSDSRTLTDLITTQASTNQYAGAAYVAGELLDDGTVLGSFQTYPDGVTPASGPFAWTLTEGLFQLDDHILAGMEHWTNVSYAWYENGEYFGSAYTRPNGDSSMGFRLYELAAADLNFDLKVDGGDLALIVEAFGTTASSADVTGDGIVDGADVLAWQRQVASGPQIVGTSASVPEPGSLLLATFAIFAGGLLRRR